VVRNIWILFRVSVRRSDVEKRECERCLKVSAQREEITLFYCQVGWLWVFWIARNRCVCPSTLIPFHTTQHLPMVFPGICQGRCRTNVIRVIAINTWKMRAWSADGKCIMLTRRIVLIRINNVPLDLQECEIHSCLVIRANLKATFASLRVRVPGSLPVHMRPSGRFAPSGSHSDFTATDATSLGLISVLCSSAKRCHVTGILGYSGLDRRISIISWFWSADFYNVPKILVKNVSWNGGKESVNWSAYDTLKIPNTNLDSMYGFVSSKVPPKRCQPWPTQI
jgi:hypothetical protein